MKILLVGFKANENSTKLLLDLIAPKYYIDKLYLEDGLSEGRMQLKKQLHYKTYDEIILFRMTSEKEEKDILVHSCAADGDKVLSTTCNYHKLFLYLQEAGIPVQISEAPVNSYTNELYLTTLRQIHKEYQNSKCILLTIPTVKNADILKLSNRLTEFITEGVCIL